MNETQGKPYCYIAIEASENGWFEVAPTLRGLIKGLRADGREFDGDSFSILAYSETDGQSQSKVVDSAMWQQFHGHWEEGEDIPLHWWGGALDEGWKPAENEDYS